MIQHEELLIKKMLEGGFDVIDKVDIDEKYFASNDFREMYRMIKRDRADGLLTSPFNIKNRFGIDIKGPDFDENLEMCMYMIKDTYVRATISKCMTEAMPIAQARDSRAMDLLDHFQKTIDKGYEALRKVDYTTWDDESKILLDHEIQDRKDQKFEGCPYPWPKLTGLTGGIQDDDFIVLYSKQKAGKTWILMNMFWHAWLFGGRRVMWISKEMSRAKVRLRLGAFAGSVAYTNLRKGNYTQDEVERIKAQIRSVNEESDPKDLIIENIKEVGPKAIDALKKKIIDHNVDLVAFDAANHLSYEWEVIRTITSRIKDEICTDMGICTMVTIQGKSTFKNKKQHIDEGAQEEIGGSISWAQDADLVIRCFLDKQHNRVYLSLPEYREDKGENLIINFFPGQNMTQIEDQTFKKMIEQQQVMNRAVIDGMQL
jgi:hypothetical protein